MTAKEYLQQIRNAHKRIQTLEARREQLRSDMYSIKSPAGSMNPDKVQSSMTGDALIKIIAQVDSMERDIVRELRKLYCLQRTITNQIDGIKDERYHTILYQRYVLFYMWEQIAVNMGIEIRWVYRLHGKALQEFGRIYSNVLNKTN